MSSFEDNLPVHRPPDPEEEARRAAEQQAAVADEQLGADLDLYERMRQAWELHYAETPYRKIAAQLGVSVATAYRWVSRYQQLAEPRPDVSAVKQRQLAEVAFLRTRIVREALTADRASRPFTAAASELVRLMAHEARITGAFAPPARGAALGDGNPTGGGGGGGGGGVPDFSVMSDDELDEWIAEHETGSGA